MFITTDQASDTLHQFFEQYSNVLITEKFKQCFKVWLSNEMLVRGIDIKEMCSQLLQQKQQRDNNSFDR